MSAERMELVTIGDEQKLVFSHGPDTFHYTDPEFGDWMNVSAENSYAEIMLKSIVSSVYDFQKLRVMVGQRIFALYNQMLGNEPGTPIYSRVSPGDSTTAIAEAAGMPSLISNEDDLDDEEMSAKLAKERQKKDSACIKIMDRICAEYQRITDRLVASRLDKKLMEDMARAGIPIDSDTFGTFESTEATRELNKIIRDMSDDVSTIQDSIMYFLVKQYISLLNGEKRAIKQFPVILDRFPIYKYFLKHVPGCGPQMAACIISKFNPHKANSAASFHMYAGLDVLEDGTGRTKAKSTMVDKEYIAADGTIKIKKSLTYDPWIKSKLIGVLAPSIIMLDRKRVYRKIYDEYKNRLNNEPWRAEALIECTSKGNVVYEENGRPKMRPAFPKIRIENMSRRYMIKMFLIDLYVHWCVLEGIPVKPPYCEEKLGLQAKLHTIWVDDQKPKDVRMVYVHWHPEKIPASILYNVSILKTYEEKLAKMAEKRNAKVSIK